MCSKLGAALAALFVVAGSSATARAQASAEAPTWRVELSLGLGTPVGLVGAHVERRIAEWFALRAGAGAALDGVQVAGMARLRVPAAPVLNYGVGLSGGPHQEWQLFCECVLPEWDFALWNNHELVLESSSDHGFVFSVALGAAILLNPNARHCGPGRCDEDAASVTHAMPYLALAFGSAFD
jgi:hypothetical protein